MYRVFMTLVVRFLAGVVPSGERGRMHSNWRRERGDSIQIPVRVRHAHSCSGRTHFCSHCEMLSCMCDDVVFLGRLWSDF